MNLKDMVFINIIDQLNKTWFKNKILYPVSNTTYITMDDTIEIRHSSGIHVFYHDLELVYIDIDLEFGSMEKFVDFLGRRIIKKLIDITKYKERNTQNINILISALTSDSLHYYNLINIINSSGLTGDSPIIYDMEGFASSNDAMYTLYTENNIIELNVGGVKVYEIKKNQNLKTLVNDIAVSLKEHYQKQSIHYASLSAKSINQSSYFEKFITKE